MFDTWRGGFPWRETYAKPMLNFVIPTEGPNLKCSPIAIRSSHLPGVFLRSRMLDSSLCCVRAEVGIMRGAPEPVLVETERVDGVSLCAHTEF